MPVDPSPLLATAWRHRGTGEVAGVWKVGVGISLSGVDDMNEHNGKWYVVADEAELRRDWVRVRRGWVLAEPSDAGAGLQLGRVYEDSELEELRGLKGGRDG